MAISFDVNNINFSDLNYMRIGVWPVQLRIGIFIMIGLITLGLGFLLVVNGLLNELTEAGNTIKTLKEAYPQKYMESLKLEPLKEDLLRISKTVELTIKQLPEDDNISQLLQEISRGMKGAKILEQQIKVENPVEKDLYYVIPFSMKLSGRYHDIGVFLNVLGQTSRIVTIQNFTLELGNQKDDMLNVNLQAETYRYNEVHKDKKT